MYNLLEDQNIKDNTVGSRSKTKMDMAYIAGFLDGDGSIMAQIKKRSDGNRTFRIMLTICFYQDSRHADPLLWIRDVLGIGYISRRNDGMTELRINGYHQIRIILEQLLPFIRFKKEQARAMYALASLLESMPFRMLSERKIRYIYRQIIRIQENNYKSSSARRSDEIKKVLGLTP